MKSFLKQYLVFLTTIILCIIVFGTALFYSLHLSSKNQNLANEISNLYNSNQELNEKILNLEYVTFDLSAATNDLKVSAQLERDLNNFCKSLLNPAENIALNWSKESVEKVNASLTRMFPRWRQKCERSNIKMPSGQGASFSSDPFGGGEQNTAANSYGFSFSSYDGSWPSFSQEEATEIGIQVEIMNEIISQLSFATDDNHSIEIQSILRESVGEIDQRNMGADQLETTGIQEFLLRQTKGVESYAFEVVLKCQTFSMRKFINNLRPPFLVRKLSLSSFDDSSNISTTSFGATPDPFSSTPQAKPQDKFMPIVSLVDSKVEIVVEYLTGIDKKVTNLHTNKNLWTDLSGEIYTNWLNESGNDEFIKSAETFLNEIADR